MIAFRVGTWSSGWEDLVLFFGSNLLSSSGYKLFIAITYILHNRRHSNKAVITSLLLHYIVLLHQLQNVPKG